MNSMPKSLPSPCATGKIPLQHRTAYVYYAYADDGDLLYVGVTDDLFQRFAEHRNRGKSPWFASVGEVKWEQYASRQIAEYVEERQIRALMPRHNLQHNWRRMEADEMGLQFLPDSSAWQRLGQRFREERTRKRLAQRVVAQRCGTDIEDIRALERATRDWYSKAFLAAVETALDWRPGSVEAVLMGGEGQPYTEAELEERAFDEARRMMWGDTA
jgi:predicted GIY-YIG superfamily endonuclease/transcriptional regulator with XRE-family HTH domain